MTQENKQLLLKDLCARLPYGVIVSIKEVDSDRKPWFGELSCKDLDCFIHDVVYESIKPYLRPMSSMTEEERKEVENIFLQDTQEIFKDPMEIRASSFYDADALDWYLKKHFDYRKLIEKGLAIDCTNLDIY